MTFEQTEEFEGTVLDLFTALHRQNRLNPGDKIRVVRQDQTVIVTVGEEMPLDTQPTESFAVPEVS